jgi:hypothetical protein
MFKKTLQRAGFIASAALMLLGATAANAVSVYTDTFQGVTFTLTGTNGTNSFTLRIQGALTGATGDWAPATTLQALGFKDLGVNFQAAGVSASMTSVPSSGWDYVQGELDANACKDPTGEKGVICFQAPSPLALTDDMLFTVTITGATLNIDALLGPHVKLQFLNADGIKQGSLYSVNLQGDTDTDTDTDTDVPEPGTLALLGLGLLGLGAVRRRKS